MIVNKIPDIDTKGLREFAIVTGSIIAIIFGLFLPWIFDRQYPYWPWAILTILFFWGIFYPDSLRPIYNSWMKFAFLLGSITTPIFLGIVFFLVFFPAALTLKLLGKDPMNRKFIKNKSTYRAKPHKLGRDNLEKPF